MEAPWRIGSPTSSIVCGVRCAAGVGGGACRDKESLACAMDGAVRNGSAFDAIAGPTSGLTAGGGRGNASCFCEAWVVNVRWRFCTTRDVGRMTTGAALARGVREI